MREYFASLSPYHYFLTFFKLGLKNCVGHLASKLAFVEAEIPCCFGMIFIGEIMPHF